MREAGKRTAAVWLIAKRTDRITENTAHVRRLKPPIELPPAPEKKKVSLKRGAPKGLSRVL